jgi:hypothetical protein
MWYDGLEQMFDAGVEERCMALEVYFKDDIAQGIIAVTVAMLSASVAHGGTNIEYCRGILDTARAQALNYGIPWTGLMSKLRGTLSDGEQGDVLDLIAQALPSGGV